MRCPSPAQRSTLKMVSLSSPGPTAHVCFNSGLTLFRKTTPKLTCTSSAPRMVGNECVAILPAAKPMPKHQRPHSASLQQYSMLHSPRNQLKPGEQSRDFGPCSLAIFLLFCGVWQSQQDVKNGIRPRTSKCQLNHQWGRSTPDPGATSALWLLRTLR